MDERIKQGTQAIINFEFAARPEYVIQNSNNASGTAILLFWTNPE